MAQVKIRYKQQSKHHKIIIMATKSNEIKKALKKAFPTIKFSVTYKHPYGYNVKWQDGIIEGATTEAVEAIAKDWDTSYRQELGGGDCYHGGDSVRYEHEITDETWKKFVIDCVLQTASSGVYFDESWNSFRDKNGKHTHWENEDYNNYLYNGIKTDLNSHDAICDRDQYYRDIDFQKIDELLEQEREYLSQLTIDPQFIAYVGQETETFKVESVKLNLKHPDYRIYNREIIYDLCSETIEKPKAFSELEIEPQFTLLDKESGEKRLANLDELLNTLDPITPVATTETQIRFTNKYDWNRKINNFKHCDRALVQQDCLITEVVKLSPEHYDRFSRQLLNNYNWLDGKGGTDTDIDFGGKKYHELSEVDRKFFDSNSYSCCVLIFAEDRQAILSDPQGYKYARYVARVDIATARQAINAYKQHHKDTKIIPFQKVVPDAPIVNQENTNQPETKVTVEPNKEKYLGHYKNWVNELINSDRATEIISYAVWLENNAQSILNSLYKEFVSNCLESDRATEIISFRDWQQQQ